MNLDVTCGRWRVQGWWHRPQAEARGVLCGMTLTTGPQPDANFSPTPAAPTSTTPPQVGAWRGLGIPPIGNRTRPVDPDTPLAESRAYTTGPDGKPIPAARSYAEQAADNVTPTHNNGT